jgi:hypothetical protein
MTNESQSEKYYIARKRVGYEGLFDLDLRHAPIDGEIHTGNE